MPAPNPYLAGAFVLGTAAYKGIKGIQQSKQGKKILANTVRPNYDIPQATTDSYNASRLNYGTNATAQEENALNSIDATGAQTIGAINQTATDSSSLLASLTAAQKSMNNAKVQAGDAAIRTHQQDLNTMINTGNTYANEVKNAWEWNKKQPYQDAMLAASSLIKAGEENKYGAINDIATAGVSLFGGGAGGEGGGVAGKAGAGGAAPNSAQFNSGINPTGGPVTDATGIGSQTQGYMGNNDLVQARQAYSSGTATPEQLSLLKANGLI